MIKCESCGFFVDSSMKFVLMQNVCPSCGHHLFSEKERSDIKTLQYRIAKQEFASDFSDTLTYDLALFIINEIKNGIGQVYLQDTLAKMASGLEPINIKFDESDMKKIREEVEEENLQPRKVGPKSVVMSSKVDPSIYESVLNDDEFIDENAYASAFAGTSDQRTERLKRLARQNSTSKGIRRVDD
jgi:predicted  nucleic acid-binding Zn-ribbon protein